jgi:ribosomal protein S2
VALSDTDNSTKFIDLVIPVNNRGRRSLAFVYYLLAREVLKERGSTEEFRHTISDFEAKVEASTAPMEGREHRGFGDRDRRGGFGGRDRRDFGGRERRPY